MKYVLGFIPHDRLDALVDTLEETHVHGLTVSEARGFGQEHDPRHPEHHHHPGVDLVRKLRVEVVCRDDELESLLESFSRLHQPGRHGAGKVFVLEVLDALRLRTGERGEAALALLAGGARAASADLLDDWRLRTEVGYTRPLSGVDTAFGGGGDGGCALGRRVGPLVAEVALQLASVSYGAARAVTAPACVVVGRSPISCAPQPVQQRGDTTVVSVGVSLPFWTRASGQSLQVGAGGLLRHLSVAPGGDSGSREDQGVYLSLTAEALSIGRAAAVGAVARASWATRRGDASAGGLPPSAHDVWLDLNLALRLGARPRPR